MRNRTDVVRNDVKAAAQIHPVEVVRHLELGHRTGAVSEYVNWPYHRIASTNQHPIRTGTK